MNSLNLKSIASKLTDPSKSYRFTKTTDFKISMIFNSPLDPDTLFGASGYMHLGTTTVENAPPESNESDPTGTKADSDKESSEEAAKVGSIKATGVSAKLADLTFYIEKVDLVNYKLGKSFIVIGDGGSDGNVGYNEVILGNSLVTPQEYELKFSVSDTEDSLIDGLFLPWMYLNAAPKGIMPTTIAATNIQDVHQTLSADIIVSMGYNDYATGNFKSYRRYIFTKCKPVSMTTPNFDHGKAEFISRDVHFAFSNMITDTNF